MRHLLPAGGTAPPPSEVGAPPPRRRASPRRVLCPVYPLSALLLSLSVSSLACSPVCLVCKSHFALCRSVACGGHRRQRRSRRFGPTDAARLFRRLNRPPPLPPPPAPGRSAHQSAVRSPRYTIVNTHSVSPATGWHRGPRTGHTRHSHRHTQSTCYTHTQLSHS
jgi:hypothetical protein